MSFSLTQVFTISACYMGLFFLLAYLTDNDIIPKRWVRHPLVYTLSLGVFASTWAIYGAVQFAEETGYNFLAYYLGMSGAFMLAPILLAPIMRLVKNYQLGSLADLLAFRYRSTAVGASVSLCMLLSTMPLLAMQIKAVAETLHILNQDTRPNILAFFFCISITLFAIVFGARHNSRREKHEGLVMAIATESLVKVIALIIVGTYILFNVFNGPSGLTEWLSHNPQATEQLYKPLGEGPWRTIIAAFFVATITTPHLFHMAFTENLDPRGLLSASWGVPIYLFLSAIFIPVILWGSQVISPGEAHEYATLQVPLALNNPVIAVLVFIAGLSAASGIMIVSTLALSTMCMNHLVIPLSAVNTQKNLYEWIRWSRHALIAAIVVASYGFYYVLAKNHSLSELGFLTFTATSQFIPGLLGVLFWAKANRRGFLWGLAAGIGIWFFFLLIPLMLDYTVYIKIPYLFAGEVPTPDNSYSAASIALLINASIFILLSSFTDATEQEKRAADTCNVDTLRRSYHWELTVTSADEFIDKLTKPLGRKTARREVALALKDLQLPASETRPFALRRLRDRLESNLSGLLGPSVAQDTVDSAIPYLMRSDKSTARDINQIETSLEPYNDKLTGLAAELDSLRRFHRQTLQDLPIGVCSLASNHEVLGWNNALFQLTNIAPENVLGSNIQQLPDPWGALITEFITLEEQNAQREIRSPEGQQRWLNLHKADLKSDQYDHDGMVIVIEDQTEHRRLEQQLGHNERLASIGRLAAGVAHEIGNPITGIACLAQNMKYETDNKEVLDASTQITEQTERVSKIVHSLVNFSHSGNVQLHLEPLNMKSLTEEAIGLIELGHRSKGLGITFVNNIPEHLVAIGDHQKLMQVLINILGNAIDASPQDGVITLLGSKSHSKTIVAIEDTGTGIPPDVLTRIYEPFVTTKEPGTGTGLGMSLVYSIIKEHEGEILIESPIHSEYGGTRVTIKLSCEE